MNPRNPEYVNLLQTVIGRLKEAVREAYTPYIENADVNDIVHYELHIVISFIVNFLIKLAQNGKSLDGKQLTIEDAYEQFMPIMDSAVKEYMEKNNSSTH